MTSRRHFLQLTAAAPFAAQAQSQAAPWFDRPMRWAQVAFTEDDPGNFDLPMWLKSLSTNSRTEWLSPVAST